MLTRREALFGAALAAAAAAAMPAFPAMAQSLDISALPREKVTLVAPPFVHAHEQVAKGGPKIVEFTMTIEEKPIVIDGDGTTLQGHDLQRLDPRPADGRPRGRLCRAHAGQPRNQRRMPHNIDFHAATGALGGGALTHDQSRRAGNAALQGDAHRNLRLPLRTRRAMIPWHVVSGMSGADHGAAARRTEERQGRTRSLRPDLLHRRERFLHSRATSRAHTKSTNRLGEATTTR